MTAVKWSSDYTQITDIAFWRHPAATPFMNLMSGRQYGREELNRAWDFFRDGWDAKSGAAVKP
jgi:hypothetical protein